MSRCHATLPQEARVTSQRTAVKETPYALEQRQLHYPARVPFAFPTDAFKLHLKPSTFRSRCISLNIIRSVFLWMFCSWWIDLAISQIFPSVFSVQFHINHHVPQSTYFRRVPCCNFDALWLTPLRCSKWIHFSWQLS